MTARPKHGVAIAIAIAVGLCVSGLVAATPSPELVELLGGIDFVPTQDDIDPFVDGVVDIVDIVTDNDEDDGLRIRAVRALGTYDTDPDRQIAGPALATVITQHGGGGNSTGVDTVYVRAAMEALALVEGPNGIAVIESQLIHTSRDVRAAAAEALQLAGSQGACNALREANLVKDEVEQVELALSEAIRELCEE
jgi:HEAT repeat protein